MKIIRLKKLATKAALPALMLTGVLSVQAQELEPVSCSLQDGNAVFSPVENVSFRFKQGIAVEESSKAVIYSGNRIVSTGIITADNYRGKEYVQGAASITFDEPLLPLGNDYRLVVPEGSIRSEEDPALTNGELSVSFNVPSSIGLTYIYVGNSGYCENRCVVSSAEYITFDLECVYF